MENLFQLEAEQNKLSVRLASGTWANSIRSGFSSDLFNIYLWYI